MYFVKQIKKRINNEKGLTLVELLAVIVILAIIAAIAIPSIGNIIENSRYKAAKSDAVNVLSAASIYFTDNADKTSVTVPELKTTGYLENEGTFSTAPDATVKKETSGNTISATVKYSGEKQVEFKSATLAQINADNRTAKAIEGGAVIPAPATSPATP